ncbi:acyl transferase acyl hydrolase lysophospholipase [Fusarium denticulatum]|uniref:Acyl transferase acyl hydrolase lysophospholipase n=1 Tax=Fusarium denticulatum TaxID=48507 RepID=A0A8H5X037_9HYPO|nr:acyl transferase acyl hydrolase lysophospholipase [Fusarium denticulatum]
MDPPLLRVLSLDGGGIRGLSSLLILEKIMERLQEVNKLDQVPKPCEWFDLIGGTSTGGIIAIMLGKLGMTVDECIRAYKKVAQQAFTPKSRPNLPGSPSGAFSAKQLEAAIKQTVKEYCIDPACVQQRKEDQATAETCPHGEMQFRGDSRTKTVVLAITKDNVDTLPTLFKTYDTSAPLDGCTVWQVARATSAATTFFKPIQVGRDQITFIDAGFGYNNPCEYLIREAKDQFPGRDEMRVLSIGTGLGDVVSIKDTRASILRALKKMATTSKKVALRLDERYGETETYHRFNVERGLEDISLSDWKETSSISSHTHNYLSENKRVIDKFIQSLTRNSNAKPAEGSNANTATKDTSNSTVHSIPFPENKGFTGRITVIDTLKEKLFKTDGCNRVALVGLGGAGKTQVALHMAYWAKGHEEDCSVFWIPAFSMAGFEQECAQLVKKLDISCSEGEDAKEVVKRHLSSGRVKRWFMVVDNADDIDILRFSRSSDKGIFNFLPHHANGRILITTRSREVAFAMKNQVVELMQMDPEEASDLLRTLLDNENRSRDDELRDEKTLTTLLQGLTYLPLAIAQAAAYMNIYKTNIAEYVQICDNADKKNIIELLEQKCDDETYYDESQSAVATTWIVSFDRIRSSNQAAADLLSFMAFIESRAIPRSILPVFETEQQTTRAIGILKSHGFLTQRGLDTIYDMHRLVHMVTRKWIEQKGELREIQLMSLTRVKLVFPRIEWKNRELWRQYLPHALQLLRCLGDIGNQNVAHLGSLVGQCLLRDNREKEAVGIFEHVVKIYDSTLPGNSEWQRNTRLFLAVAYLETELGEKAVEILQDIQVLAIAYLGIGQVQKSVDILKLVTNITQQTLAENDPDLLASQHALAEAYIDIGQAQLAVEILESVTKIQEGMLSEDHPDRLPPQHTLARAYISCKQAKKAIEILEWVDNINWLKHIFKMAR